MPTKPRPRSGFVGIARVGLPLGGSGTLKPQCEGQCGAFSLGKQDYDEASSLFAGAELLWHASPAVRLGAGLLATPTSQIEADGSSREDELGTDLSAQAVLEGVFDLGPKTWLALRGQAGLMTLFPGGDLSDSIDELETTCNQGGTRVCTVDDGPYLGFTFGGGPGLVFPLQKVNLRVDLWIQWYSLNDLLRTKSNSGSTNFDVGYDSSGTRTILSGGLEL